MRSCTLLDVKTYLGPNPPKAQPAKKKIRRIPLTLSAADMKDRRTEEEKREINWQGVERYRERLREQREG